MVKIFDKRFWRIFIPIIIISVILTIISFPMYGARILGYVLPIFLFGLIIPFIISYILMSLILSKNKILGFFMMFIPIAVSLLSGFLLYYLFPNAGFYGEGMFFAFIFLGILGVFTSILMLIVYLHKLKE